MVDTGDDIVQVVCGAPNAHTGMKAVFARPGAVIPVSGEALKISAIRGVESRGMLCSGRELLLSDDHDGIIEIAGGCGASAHRRRMRCGLNDAVIECRSRPIAAIARASMASRAIWPRPGWALEAWRRRAGCRNFRCTKSRSSPISPGTRIRRMSVVRRPAGAQRQERPEPALAAGPPARRRTAPDLGAGRRDQFHRAWIAAGRCMCSMPTSSRATSWCGWRAMARC